MAFSYRGLGHLQEDDSFYRQCDWWNTRTSVLLSHLYLFWVPMKLIHFVMSCWMASSASRWACSVFSRWDLRAVSCSFHWSVNAVMVFRYSVSFKKRHLQPKLKHKKKWWKYWKGCAWQPWTTGKCCSVQLFLANSAHWDAVGWRAAASSCQSSGGKKETQLTNFLTMYIHVTVLWTQLGLKCGWTHLEGEAKREIFPLVSLLSHLQQLRLQAAPLQLVELVVTLDHTERGPIAIEQEDQI